MCASSGRYIGGRFFEKRLAAVLFGSVGAAHTVFGLSVLVGFFGLVLVLVLILVLIVFHGKISL